MSRKSHDFYPTPPCAVAALRMALAEDLPRFGVAGFDGLWLDPAAGAGTLLEWLGVPRSNRLAIEVRPDAELELAKRLGTGFYRVGVDALSVEWMEWMRGCNVAMNPPFSHLEQFVRKGLDYIHKSGSPTVMAVLAPTQWLQAAKRRDLRDPAAVYALRWRPRFDASQDGGMMYDVAWHVWATLDRSTERCSIRWVDRPAVPMEQLAEWLAIAEPAVARQIGLFDHIEEDDNG